MIQNDLSINARDLRKSYVIGNKPVMLFFRATVQKNAGGKNEGFSHYVIENIRSEIAILGLATMCMKTKHVIASEFISI
jgi:hypothetical protein